MKTYATFLVMLGIIGFLGWRLYIAEEEKKSLQADLDLMNEHALSLEKDILALQQDMKDLEKSTIKGAVEEANNAILHGWESFINRVQKELGEVQREIQEEFAEPDTAPPGDDNREAVN